MKTQAKSQTLRASAQGLTLIEVMIAVALFMVLMLAVTSSMPSLFKLNRATTSTQSISVYAKNVVDQTRGYWLTPSGSTDYDSDHYPNLTSGALPDNLPPVPPGLSCERPQTVEVASITAPTSTPYNTVTWTTRRRITVSCRPAEQPSAAATQFVAEVGRPE